MFKDMRKRFLEISFYLDQGTSQNPSLMEIKVELFLQLHIFAN